LRLRSRTDKNQGEVVKTFRALGCSVQHLHTVGKGCPDILIGYRGINLLVEIKDGSLIPSAKKLTLDEQGWHERWLGQVCIVDSSDSAIDLIKRVGAQRIELEPVNIYR